MAGTPAPLALLFMARPAGAQAPAPEPAEAPAQTGPEADAPESQEPTAPEPPGVAPTEDSPEDSSPPAESDEALVLSTPAGPVEVGGRLDVRETLERPQGGIWAGELTIPAARVEVSYRWKKRLRAVVEFDGRGELKDAFIWLKIARGFSTRAGRFKIPLSLVELESTTKLPLARRGLLRDVLDDALGLSGRSPGAQLEWKCPGCTQQMKLVAGAWQTRDPDTKGAVGVNAGQWERWRVQAQFEVRKAGSGAPPVLEALEESLASRRAPLVQLEVGF